MTNSNPSLPAEQQNYAAPQGHGAPIPTAPILAMEGVCLSFGPKRVLDGLTFNVRRGECFGFLGPSGAGKTTTIKLLTRQLTQDTGRIQLFGRPIEHASNADYDRIGILSDTSALYERLSIEENLRLYASIRGRGQHDIDRLLERMKLSDDRRTLIKTAQRHAPASRPPLRARPRPRAALSRRADLGPRPRRAGRGSSDALRAQARRGNDLHHHARHGRGRGALRPPGNHRPRSHHRTRRAAIA